MENVLAAGLCLYLVHWRLDTKAESGANVWQALYRKYAKNSISKGKGQKPAPRPCSVISISSNVRQARSMSIPGEPQGSKTTGPLQRLGKAWVLSSGQLGFGDAQQHLLHVRFLPSPACGCCSPNSTWPWMLSSELNS